MKSLLLGILSVPLSFALPIHAAQLITNPDFESSPFDSGWTANGVTEEVVGADSAARLPYNTSATLGQTFAAVPDFTFDCIVEVAGNSTADSFHVFLDSGGGTAIEIRGRLGNVIQLNIGGVYRDLTAMSGGSNFPFAGNVPVRIQVVGRDFGASGASYDVAWSEPNSTVLSHSVTGLRDFLESTAATTGSGLTGVRFDRVGLTGHSYWMDDVTVTDAASSVPTADYTVELPGPDKVVLISGVYPHLTMTNNEPSEVGIGAIVPWADRLWAITYMGHAPNGSTDKLWEITPELEITARPESIGGTPANRFIHTASQQLNIGNYFIDADRNVRVLPYTLAPGRPTATAAHLTDPDNRLYILTMDNGLYDINVHDLSFITRYPDVQSRGDRFLHGYHGKGLYSGQGQLVAANNGRPKNQSVPTGEAGVLATWDGTTVADNGGSYFSTNEANTGIGDNTGAPVSAQPEYMAGWKQHYKVQHCEVTGPGGIYGSSDPVNDPIWATGFDDKSVVVRVMEDGQTWNTWRLPKGSYTHDGSHGWHTEWPRIRQIDPADSNSPYLMHMHGLFYNFPPTFSAANFSGLAPICSFYKMPTDYAMFNGKLVMGKDDASFFQNPLTLRTQSNLWFGEFEDLNDWGSPHGHGAVWKDENVAASAASEPFLMNGFSQASLHLKHATTQSVDIQIESSNGDGNWTPHSTVTIPAGSYLPVILNDFGAEWIRLKATDAVVDLTAFFMLANPYPHVTPASLKSDEFAALADIRDEASYSDGLLRVMADADLRLEVAASAVDAGQNVSETGYHIVGGQMVLKETADATAEADLRADAVTSKVFSSDAASVWVNNDISGKIIKLRLPRIDAGYDAQFASGWPRAFREIVTERSLLNCHGTFYEIPRTNSAGRYRMRPISTHGKRITDFASWRGLLVLTGVLDDAPESDRLLRNAEGAALWLGEADDMWMMGEPRGYGGPWLDTAVTAGAPSDAYLMYGYDHKELTLSHDSDVAVDFTIEVDFLANYTWSAYTTLTVQPGESRVYTFPAGFRAHWVRVTSDTDTNASAQLVYGPADQRDALIDWARDESLPTAFGRTLLLQQDSDGDGFSEAMEYVLGTSPLVRNSQPVVLNSDSVSVVLRDEDSTQNLKTYFDYSTNLKDWTEKPERVSLASNQSGVVSGFGRWDFAWDTESESKEFVRIRLEP